MLKTWSFWITFLASYITLVTGIWGFVEAYTYFENNSLKQLLGSNWWIVYYLLPLFIAFSFAALTNAKEEAQAETLDQRNRRVMLNHVENFWVKGILEKSLDGVALLELGIKEDPGAVSYPWTIKRESTNETLPVGKSMLEIFEEVGLGRSLLILGAPGSGKTTMLLELARQLIEHARLEESEPIPVVFNLSSWKQKQTLADWLAEQLNIVYYVPKKTASAWVNENRMLLLLDGLDEVKGGSRLKCVEAINQFRREHGLISLVACSRIAEYAALNTKLSLEGAIILQPLTSEQIKAYFDRFGKSFATIKQLLTRDEALQELAETPLMLSIMALAYKDKKADELVASETLEGQRTHLFDTYIARMFERSTRTTNVPFSKQQTLHSLCWLARMMSKHNIVTYQIEAMQPSWLEEENQRRLYQLVAGPIVGLVAAMIAGMIIGLFYGLIAGPNYGLITGLFGGSTAGLIAGRLIVESGEIRMVGRLKWSWKKAQSGLIADLNYALSIGLIIGLIIELIIALILGLYGGLIGEQIEETTRPAQHLRQTLFATILVVILGGLIFGPICGLTVGLIFWQIFDLNYALNYALQAGLMFMLFLGLLLGSSYGGTALIRHYSLRFVLMRNEFLPQHLIPLLEYAVDLIFLRRVGGSYIFVHRTLMEHFADMEV